MEYQVCDMMSTRLSAIQGVWPESNGSQMYLFMWLEVKAIWLHFLTLDIFS